MASWVRDKNGNWTVIASMAEINASRGSLGVHKKSGESQIIQIGSVSRPFIAKYGEYAGKECAFVIPLKMGHSSYGSSSFSTSKTQRCIACEYDALDQMDRFREAEELSRQYGGRRCDIHTCGRRS